MELPMAGQAPQQQDQQSPPMSPAEQQPAEQQGQQQEGGGNSKNPFPESEAEALKFSNDILQVIHDERTHGNIVKQLDDVDDSAKGQGVGVIAAHIVGNRVADVRGQTGRKIEMRLVVGALQAVVSELSAIAQDNKFFEMSPKEKQQALESSVAILDQMGKGKGAENGS